MKTKKNLISLTILSSLFILSLFMLTAVNNNAAVTRPVNLIVYNDSTTDSTTFYTCPMHPEGISDKPGQCPKCRMDLVPQKKDEKDQGMKCPDMEKCKTNGCDVDNCKGSMGSCMNNCHMMKEHKHDSKVHDHNSKDNDDSDGHKHKSCCKKGC
jgi:hypothetical protein